MGENVPKQTLYVRNLNEKIHPEKLKLLLYTYFSRFGTVLEVDCKRTRKLRGQAWIVFKEIEQAARAKDKLSGRTLCGKEMIIQFAKTQSDAAIKVKDPEAFRERLRMRREKHQNLAAQNQQI